MFHCAATFKCDVEHDVGQQPNHIHLDPTADLNSSPFPLPPYQTRLHLNQRERERESDSSSGWVYDEIENTFNAPWFIIVSLSISLSLSGICEVCMLRSYKCYESTEIVIVEDLFKRNSSNARKMLCLSSWSDPRSSILLNARSSIFASYEL